MDSSEMLAFVKALADADRLRIVGLLAQKPARPAEIAACLGLPPSETARALDQLVHGGVLRLSDGGYELDHDGLETLARRQFEGHRPDYVPDPGLEKRTRRVLSTYLNPDGTIKQVPLQAAKLRILLDYLINAFTVGASYSEKEVNLILARFHPDTSGLRRDLVDAGLLARERDGSRYWRPAEPAKGRLE
jgi:hypothetical protein